MHEAYYGLLKEMKKKGVTQAELAKLIKISPVTFNLKVNGTDGRDFKVTEAKKIADFLGIKFSDFFET